MNTERRATAAREAYDLTRWLRLSGTLLHQTHDHLAKADGNLDTKSLIRSEARLERDNALIVMDMAISNFRAARALDLDLVHPRLSPAIADTRLQLTGVRRTLDGATLLIGDLSDLRGATLAVAAFARSVEATADLAYEFFRLYSGQPRTIWRRDAVQPVQSTVSAADLISSDDEDVAAVTGVPGALVTVATLMLPASRRTRYREEFRSDLYEDEPDRRLGHATRIALTALPLRISLMRELRAARRQENDR